MNRVRACLRWLTTNGRRLAVLVTGVAFLGAGLAMLVLPGPGVVVCLVGLAILATEFAWAERALARTRHQATRATASITSNRTGRALFVVSAVAMLAGGIAAVAFLERHRFTGASAAIAGLCSLVVLLPRVQRWLAASTVSTPEPQLRKGP